jgi:hypothetical protein
MEEVFIYIQVSFYLLANVGAFYWIRDTRKRSKLAQIEHERYLKHLGKLEEQLGVETGRGHKAPES